MSETLLKTSQVYFVFRKYLAASKYYGFFRILNSVFMYLRTQYTRYNITYFAPILSDQIAL